MTDLASGTGCDVVLPTRDRGERIVGTLRSVFDGVLVPRQCIVVDQSVDDRTRTAVEPWVRDGRVRYVNGPPRGISAGINLGVVHGREELIAVTGDDCTVEPEWLLRLTEAFDESDTGVVFGSILPAGPASDSGFFPSYCRSDAVVARGLLQQGRIAGTSASMGFRRDVWSALRGFDEEMGLGAPFGAAEDVDFTMRALSASFSVRETPIARVCHHGFFAWSERAALIRRNWFGTGAAFGKCFKQRPSIALTIFANSVQWLRGRSPIVQGLGPGGFRAATLRAFAAGALAGLRTRVDPATGHFSPRAGASAPTGGDRAAVNPSSDEESHRLGA